MIRLTLEDNVQGRDVGTYFYHFNERDNIGIYSVKMRKNKKGIRAEYVGTVASIPNAQDVCIELNSVRKPIINPYNYISRKKGYKGIMTRRDKQNSLDDVGDL